MGWAGGGGDGLAPAVEGESRTGQYRGNATEPFDDTGLPCSQFIRRAPPPNGSTLACQMGGLGQADWTSSSGGGGSSTGS